VCVWSHEYLFRQQTYVLTYRNVLNNNNIMLFLASRTQRSSVYSSVVEVRNDFWHKYTTRLFSVNRIITKRNGSCLLWPRSPISAAAELLLYLSSPPVGRALAWHAPVFSERSLYAIARPSVVCNVRAPNFRQYLYGTRYLGIHWHPLKISRRSSQGNPSIGGVKRKRGSQI